MYKELTKKFNCLLCILLWVATWMTQRSERIKSKMLEMQTRGEWDWRRITWNYTATALLVLKMQYFILLLEGSFPQVNASWKNSSTFISASNFNVQQKRNRFTVFRCVPDYSLKTARFQLRCGFTPHTQTEKAFKRFLITL